MSSVLDLLKGGAIVLVFIGVVTASFFIVGKGQELIAEKSAEISDIADSATDFVIAQYQNSEVDTSGLYDAVNNYQGEFEIRIQTGAMQKASMTGGYCEGFPDESLSGRSDSNPNGHLWIWLNSDMCEYFVYPISEDDVDCRGGNDFDVTHKYSSCVGVNPEHILTFKQNLDRQDSNSPFFINPDAKWYSTVFYESGEAAGILFRQVI